MVGPKLFWQPWGKTGITVDGYYWIQWEDGRKEFLHVHDDLDYNGAPDEFVGAIYFAGPVHIPEPEMPSEWDQ